MLVGEKRKAVCEMKHFDAYSVEEGRDGPTDNFNISLRGQLRCPFALAWAMRRLCACVRNVDCLQRTPPACAAYSCPSRPVTLPSCPGLFVPLPASYAALLPWFGVSYAHCGVYCGVLTDYAYCDGHHRPGRLLLRAPEDVHRSGQ